MATAPGRVDPRAHLVLPWQRPRAAPRVGDPSSLELEDREERPDLVEQAEKRQPGQVRMEGEAVQVEVLAVKIEGTGDRLIEERQVQLVAGTADDRVELAARSVREAHALTGNSADPRTNGNPPLGHERQVVLGERDAGCCEL